MTRKENVKHVESNTCLCVDYYYEKTKGGANDKTMKWAKKEESYINQVV